MLFRSVNNNRTLDAGNDPYAYNMNQYVRTSDNVQFTRMGIGQAVDSNYRVIAYGDYYANAGGNYWAEGRFKQYRGSGTWWNVIDEGNIGSFTAGNVNSISSATGGSYTWTSTNYFQSNLGAYSGSLSSPPLQAYATGGNSAFMSFHRSGSYAVNFGLDADNVLRIGGWSASANRWELDMSGNNSIAGNFTSSGAFGSNGWGGSSGNQAVRVFGPRGASAS